MSSNSPNDAASQPPNLLPHAPPQGGSSGSRYSDNRPTDLDISTSDIQLLKSLVDAHLAHFQSGPEPSPTDKDKFLRLSTSSNRSVPLTKVEREEPHHNDQDLHSAYTYLVTANLAPISPAPSRTDSRSKQFNMCEKDNQPQLDLKPHPAPSTSTTMVGTSHTASRKTSTTSLTGEPTFIRPNTGDPESQASTPAEWKPHRTEYLIMFTLACASLLVALDSDILVASLPALAHHLNGTTTEAFWAGSAYLLPYAVVQPFLACLSDIFGRRPILLLSLALFLTGSLPCALATSMPALLAGRVVQGVGGGGIVALTQAIYTDIVPLRQRPKYFGIVLLAWAVGTTAGPVLGGAFTDMADAGWRWCFWINFPLGGAALVLSCLLVRLQPAASPLSLAQKLRTVDYAGALLFGASITAALVAASCAGNLHAWTAPQTLVPLLLGLAGLVAFAVYERFVAKYPFVPRAVFPSCSAALLFALAFLYGLVLFMGVYYITFYFSVVRLNSATRAGANLVPALALALPSSIVCGVLMTRWGRWRWAVWGGHALECVGYGLLVRLDERTPVVQWALTLCVAGLGSGVSLSSINFGVQATTTTERDSAGATVMYTFLRSVGMCVGVSVGGTVFQNVAGAALVRRGLDREIASQAEQFVFGTLRFLGEQEEMRREVVGAFVEGLRAVFWCMLVGKAVAFVGSLFVRTQSMDRELDGRYKVRETGGGEKEKGCGRCDGERERGDGVS